MSELELLKEELYGDADTCIADIKFYPGRNDATPEDVAAAVRSAFSAIKAGNFHETPLSIPK